MLKSYVLLAGFIVVTASSQAQTIENLNTIFDGDKVIVTYSLTYADASQKFKVALYSSHDNYNQPILVTGDAGENVLPGKVKRAVWDAKSALPADFDGDIRIKIKTSRVAAPKLTFEPLALQTYKRGRTISMKWTGGYSTDKIHIELYKDNKVNLLVVDQIDNTTSYEWKMPKSVKGRNYTLHISNAAKPNELAESAAFRVKPRTPFIIKALPFVVVGGAVYFFTGSDGGEPPGGGDGLLPGPLKPN